MCGEQCDAEKRELMMGSLAEPEQSWRDLVPRYNRRLRAYFRRARWAGDEIEDLVWDAWALALEREGELHTTADLWPMLRKAAAQASAGRLRVRRHEVPLPDGLVAAAPADARAESEDDAQTLAHWNKWALAQLPKQQRLAVDYRHRWSWPYWVVAAAVDTTESTARGHVRRGLAALRKIAVESPPPPARGAR
jgi:RNA polymerase sigma-70 factor (ECF subfamily)